MKIKASAIKNATKFVALKKRETGIEFGIAHKPYKIKEESTLSMGCPGEYPHFMFLRAVKLEVSHLFPKRILYVLS